jgi:hypothetical protein
MTPRKTTLSELDLAYRKAKKCLRITLDNDLFNERFGLYYGDEDAVRLPPIIYYLLQESEENEKRFIMEKFPVLDVSYAKQLSYMECY